MLFPVHRPSGEMQEVEARSDIEAISATSWPDGCVIYKEQLFHGPEQGDYLKVVFKHGEKRECATCSLSHLTEETALKVIMEHIGQVTQEAMA